MSETRRCMVCRREYQFSARPKDLDDIGMYVCSHECLERIVPALTDEAVRRYRTMADRYNMDEDDAVGMEFAAETVERYLLLIGRLRRFAATVSESLLVPLKGNVNMTISPSSKEPEIPLWAELSHLRAKLAEAVAIANSH